MVQESRVQTYPMWMVVWNTKYFVNWSRQQHIRFRSKGVMCPRGNKKLCSKTLINVWCCLSHCSKVLDLFLRHTHVCRAIFFGWWRKHYFWMDPHSHWATEPDACVTIKLGASGLGASPPITVIDLFRNTVSKHGTRPAMGQKKKVDVRNWSFHLLLWLTTHIREFFLLSGQSGPGKSTIMNPSDSPKRWSRWVLACTRLPIFSVLIRFEIL